MVTKEEFGARLRTLRLSRKLTQQQLGEMVNKSSQYISDIELGHALPTASLVHELERALDGGGTLVIALKSAKVPPMELQRVSGKAHLFYPAVVPGVARSTDVHATPSWPRVIELDDRSGDAVERSLHVFPFDVVVVHECHARTELTLTQIARWRRQVIDRHETAVQQHVDSLHPDLRVIGETYCLATFVAEALPHSADRRDRVLQLLACPSALLATEDTPHPGEGDLDIESDLIHSRDKIADFHRFGSPGRHVGWASWSGVAIHTTSPAAPELQDFVAMEADLQAHWCLANHVVSGLPISNPLVNRDLLLSARRRFDLPKATEHTMTQSMRQALARSSGVRRLLKNAADALN